MTVIKIDLEKPIQEFEIGGKVYQVPYDDESLRKYQATLQRFQKDVNEAARINFDNLPAEEQKQKEEEYLNVAKKLIECFFGEGSYDSIYEAAGKSVFLMTKVLEQLLEWFEKKFDTSRAQKRAYYTKNKGKRNHYKKK